MQEEKLKKAYVAAENANKAKTEFLNNMSHDIRTPMNVILGYNHLMKSQLTESKQLDYQKKIEQSGNCYWPSSIMCLIWPGLKAER